MLPAVPPHRDSALYADHVRHVYRIARVLHKPLAEREVILDAIEAVASAAEPGSSDLRRAVQQHRDPIKLIGARSGQQLSDRDLPAQDHVSAGALLDEYAPHPSLDRAVAPRGVRADRHTDRVKLDAGHSPRSQREVNRVQGAGLPAALAPMIDSGMKPSRVAVRSAERRAGSRARALRSGELTVPVRRHSGRSDSTAALRARRSAF
jgi:hypothetical protein